MEKVPITSYPAKLEEAYELGKNLGASERDALAPKR